MITPDEQAYRVKTDLLLHGARLRFGSSQLSSQRIRQRVRSGSCGGLDLLLGGDVLVNVPVREHFAQQSPYEIEVDDEQATVTDVRTGESLLGGLMPLPGPAMAIHDRIGQVCGDRLGIGLFGSCRFWRRDDAGCRFCSIGLNAERDDHRKTADAIRAAVLAAYTDTSSGVAHVLLGGGTPPSDDAGAAMMAEAADAISSLGSDDPSLRRPIYGMLVPPADVTWIDRLVGAGVDEIGMNIEAFSPDARDLHLHMKSTVVPLSHYEKALCRSVELLGPVHTRSILVVGLESPESALAGVRWMAERGVMPILSLLRPLDDTRLSVHDRHPGLSRLDDVMAFIDAAAEIADQHGLPLGPTCRGCQGNSLTTAHHPAYRWYGTDSSAHIHADS